MKESSKVSENSVVAYFHSAIEEFGKITWPTKEQTAMLTAVTIVVSAVVALLIGLVDFGFNEAYKVLLNVF